VTSHARRRCLRALGALPCLAALPARAEPTPEALAALAAADARVRGLEAVRAAWDRVDETATQLGWAASTLSEAWADAVAADAEARHAVAAARDGARGLDRAVGARLAAAQRLLASAQRTRECVAALAVAPPATLLATARQGDAAFAARHADEDRCHALELALRQAAGDAAGSRVLARDSLDGDAARLAAVLEAAAALGDRVARLRAAAGQATQAGGRAVAARWWPLDPFAGVPPEPAAMALASALPALRRATAPPADAAGPGDAASDGDAFESATARWLRLEDAAAYLRLAGAGAADALASERAAVADRGPAHAAMLQARHALLADASEAGHAMAPLAAALAARGAAFAAQSRRVPQAVRESQAVSAHTLAGLASARPALEAAIDAAQDAWRQAWIEAYGTPPARTSTARPPPPVIAGSGVGAGTSAGGAVAAPVGHVYDFFDTFDAERRGYRCYTYVLLRSAADLASPTVHARWQALLDTVRREADDAQQVDAEQAQSRNLFCIPVIAARESRHPDLAYSGTLGCQLKLRMQGGLFTRPELRGRLVDSPGPWLLTLPTRLSAADSRSPLLFADLGGYPPDAIADLATSYMTSLLKEFPDRQAQWRPPGLQRVALELISLAQQAGGLVQTVIPAAQAQPHRGG